MFQQCYAKIRCLMACSIGICWLWLLAWGAQAATLVPGTGWTGATAQPPQQRTGMAADKNAIARWDAVPCQAISDSLNVGVVAFHINGIEKVSFSLDNGPWLDVTSMTLNPEDSVMEYWATFKASTVSDGPVEIRAIAYPKVGVPRVLDSLLFLYANAGHSLPNTVKYVSTIGNDITGDGTEAKPFKTIGKATVAIRQAIGPLDGATIYLQPGDYVYLPDPNVPYGSEPVTNNTYLTITAALGITADQVGLVGGNAWGLSTIRHVHIKGVTIKQTQLNSNGNYKTYFWIERTKVVGGGIAVDSAHAGVNACKGTTGGSSIYGGLYVTESEFSNNCGNSLQGRLIRNTYIHNISGDAFETPDLIVNTVVDTQTQLAGQHADVYQNQYVLNDIIYGLRATNITYCQGLSMDPPLTNIAIINTTIAITGSYHNSIFGGNMTNIYILNSNFTGGCGYYSAPDSRALVPNDFVIENSTLVGLGAYPGVTFRTTTKITEKPQTLVVAVAPNIMVSLYDLMGRKVAEAPLGKIYQVRALRSGIYLLVANDGQPGKPLRHLVIK